MFVSRSNITKSGWIHLSSVFSAYCSVCLAPNGKNYGREHVRRGNILYIVYIICISIHCVPLRNFCTICLNSFCIQFCWMEACPGNLHRSELNKMLPTLGEWNKELQEMCIILLFYECSCNMMMIRATLNCLCMRLETFHISIQHIQNERFTIIQ